MDGQPLRWLYHRLLHDPIASRTRDCTYCDGLIALVGLFAVANNRSVRWAADRRRWPVWFRRSLPSYSQLRRRLLSPRVRRLMQQVDRELLNTLGHSTLKRVDGKPLIVSAFSRDRDATRGHVPGGSARGYKLHVLQDAVTGVIELARVTGLARGEATVLRRMIPRAALRGSTVRADANYDSNRLYAAVATRGGRFLAPRRKPGRALGHGRQHPDRLRAILDLEQTPGGRAGHDHLRGGIERCFADLGQRVGLFALPPFVRRLRRVRPWIRAKLLLYHLTLRLDQIAR